MGTRFQILVFMCDVFEKYNVHLGVICTYLKLYLRKIIILKVLEITHIYDFCNF